MWDLFKDWIFDVIHFFYDYCGDWGLAIIVITIIFRLLMTPLIYKSSKSNYQMQKIQPQVQKIQDRYANDQTRMQEEMQKLYAEAKFNPLAGCLPMFLQMPIFIALFQVLSNMEELTDGSFYGFYTLVPNLTMSPSDALEVSFDAFIPYLILMIIFAGATFLPMVLMQMGKKDNPQRNQTLIIAGVMSVFMLWISWGSPAGVLLFWGVSSIIGVAQQQASMYLFKKKDAAVEAETQYIKPVEVDVVRKTKKPRPTKKSAAKKK